MRASLTTHGSWLLITMATFVVGSRLARRESLDLHPMDPVVSGRAIEVRDVTEADPAGTPSLPGTANANGSKDGSGNLGVLTFPSEVGNLVLPLTESQINELAIAATKSLNPIERRKAFDRLLQEMQSDTFTVEQAMMMRSALHENGASGEQWRAFDYAWGANDPQAALAHIDEIPGQYRDGFTSNLLPGLASVEPQLAIDLVSTMQGQKNFPNMTGRLIEGLADYDIGFATDYVGQLLESGQPGANVFVRRLAHEVLGTVGLADGLAWAEGLDPGPMQANALRSVAHAYTHQDASGAAHWAEQFVGQDQNSRLFGEVVREWGDVAAATEWVNSLEPSLAKRDALSAVYGFLGAMEPHEAVQDIINMPDSDDRNFAINGFISGLAGQDGEAAVTWAAEISSQGLREAAMIRAGQKYFQQDQQAATDWFLASGLPETAWNQVAVPK